MKYIALLRGVNVGGSRLLKMQELKEIFEALGFRSVSTYINSGNVIFESDKKITSVIKEIEATFKKNFGFEIPTLIKTEKEMKRIALAISPKWQNDDKQRTDVAYLFKEADSKKILNDLPLNKEYVETVYVKGALIWNINRKNYSKSRLNKLIGHKFYKFMTIRNANTARYLADL